MGDKQDFHFFKFLLIILHFTNKQEIRNYKITGNETFNKEVKHNSISEIIYWWRVHQKYT